ncbi:NFACT family protein [Helicobacter pametensis]|uniref:NFACT family protein n=1 Tax=Helicobacter pametensis TaxID=95149 RepID=UPI0004AE9924|nr:NFACT family protein [Helicobacter pametensis]
MKLEVLRALAQRFSNYATLYHVRRVDDNLFRLSLDFDDFYIDVSKSRSSIFQTREKILGHSYHAPFDLALTKYTSRSKLLSCALDGNNRILIFEFMYLAGYKQEKYYLHFELTGKHTNVILVDQNKRVVEALRHIGESRSSRVIRPNKEFESLPQPTKPIQQKEAMSQDALDVFLHEEYILRQIQRISQKKQVILQRKSKKLQDYQMLLDQLPNPSDLLSQSQQYALWGELIFASCLPSYFSHTLTLRGYQGEEVLITLPSVIKSYAQGGNFCFAQSKRLKQKLKNLRIQKEHLLAKIEFLQKQIAYIQRIDNEGDLQAFIQPKSYKKEKIQREYESFFIEGVKISIGRNSKENQRLLEDAKADDIWLHIQDIPSSHMIIHCGKTRVRDEVLHQSAKMLLGINGMLDRNILVDYTQRRFVKMVDGAHVLYSKQKTLRF